MTTQTATVLVTGATGRQGGATARHLLADGWNVRALVRDPATPAARALAGLGAELVRGDMDDLASVENAALGAYGVYSVQPSFIAPDFAENELQRGLNVAEAAAYANVEHLVYSSVAGADSNSGVPHWEVKWRIEQHIRSLDIPSTVLRPVMFMEVHADPLYGLTGAQAAIRSIPAHGTVQLIAVQDIGAFGALAFGYPEHYVCKTIEIAGDELTAEELLTATSRAIGRSLPPPHDPTQPSGRSDVGQRGFFAGWQADITALREQHPGLMSFDTWLAREGAARIGALFDQHQRHDL
ncbi:NmrA/HSCARG family protein [Streptomyces sp. PA03-3a]|nr:NmrA/HSCARG family protein [Streptomyces sp. PA03-3a]